MLNYLLFFIFLFYTGLFCRTHYNEPDYFLGGQFIYNFRIGSYHFKHLEMRQDTLKERLLLGGFSLGKRYYLNSWARIQVGALVHFGSINEPSPSVKYQYKHIGVDLDIHYVNDITHLLNVFFILGGGINRIKLECRAINFDTICWGPSLNIGIGYDHIIVKNIMLTVSYLQRFWRPIAYFEREDFPFEPIKYQETFYSHIFKIDLFFNLIK